MNNCIQLEKKWKLQWGKKIKKDKVNEWIEDNPTDGKGKESMADIVFYGRIVGSVVECSPATRAARVRFPDDACFCLIESIHFLPFLKILHLLLAA